MGIALGLMTAVFWGLSDFYVRPATQRIGPYQALFLTQSVGSLLIAVLWLLTGAPLPHTASTAGLLALLSVANLGGTLCLYRALQVGSLAVVSPIASAGAAVTVVLALLFGFHLTTLLAAGMILVFVGILAASTHGRIADAAGAGWAACTAVAFGLVAFLLGVIAPRTGPVLPILSIRVVAVVLLAAFAPVTSRRLSYRHPGTLWRFVVISAVLDAGGFLAFNSGVRLTADPVVSMLASLFAAVSALLGWLVLHERLKRHQWLGVAAVLLGVAVLSA